VKAKTKARLPSRANASSNRCSDFLPVFFTPD
jgi:hypothetical protein